MKTGAYKKDLGAWTFTRLARSVVRVIAAASLFTASDAQSVIDFETLPTTGSPASRCMVIHDQYAAAPFGVLFEVVGDGMLPFNPRRHPQIAVVRDGYEDAFQGCPGDDGPIPNQGVGSRFLTDDCGVDGPNHLLVTYVVPVAAASGVIVDVDAGSDRTGEAWRITAFDGTGAMVGSPFQIVAPVGPDQPCAQYPGLGPGDGVAFPWSVASPTLTNEISRVFFEYVGSAPIAGLAFDNFSVSGVQSSCFTRNGGGGNPLGFACVSTPTIGTAWTTTVDTLSPPSLASVLGISFGGPTSGLLLAGIVRGELLCLSPFAPFDVSTSGVHVAPIPLDFGLIGLVVSTQAATYVPGLFTLQNALDVTIGSF